MFVFILKTKINIWLALLLLLCVTSLPAQKILVVNKPGKEKRIRFYVKDNVHVKLKGEKYILHGMITAVGDSSVDIDGFRVPIQQVKLIYDYEKRRWAALWSSILFTAGAAFIALDVVNRTTQDLQPIFVKRTFVASSSIIAAGLVLHLAKVKKYRMNKRHWLQIIDLGNNE